MSDSIPEKQSGKSEMMPRQVESKAIYKSIPGIEAELQARIDRILDRQDKKRQQVDRFGYGC